MRGILYNVSLAAVAFWSTTVAGAGSDDAGKALSVAIAKVDPKISVQFLEDAPVQGLHHVSLDGTSGYVTADGRYFIRGDLFDVATRANLSEEGRKDVRAKALKKLEARDAIVFSPANPKYTITVFTDVDCGYCRKLHKDMAKLNELGVAVQYIAYPRSGPGTESWTKAEAVWCAADRRDAITRAKSGEKVAKPADCVTTPIAAQYALGEKLGVKGTPMIVLEDGSEIGGYMPPAQLAQELDKRLAVKTASRH